jgi:hypothetical protein
MAVRAPLLFSLVSVVCLAAGGVGCGPSVGEARLVSAPARAASCELEFLQLEIQDMAPGGKYEILGHVVLSEEGIRDPLAPAYRDKVRPRACAMGGEAVAILMTGTAAPHALSAGGTTIDYAIVRRRTTPPRSTPKKF